MGPDDMLQLTEDSFRFSAEAAPQSGMDKMMEAITEGLERHLGGKHFCNHITASLEINAGRLHLSLTASTPLGAEALKQFTAG